MRRVALPLALALTLVATSPALAGGGLPKLGSVRAGPYTVSLHNDSHALVTGRNTLTLEVPGLADERAVALYLVGPNGQTIEVPLRRVTVLGGQAGHSDADAHGSSNGQGAGGDDHGAAKDDHGAATDDHGPATDGHGAAKPPANERPSSTTDPHGASSDDHDAAKPAATDNHGAAKPAATDNHGAAKPAATDRHGSAGAAPPRNLDLRQRTEANHLQAAAASARVGPDGHGSPALAGPITDVQPHDADGHGHGDASVVGAVVNPGATPLVVRGAVAVPADGTWRARVVVVTPEGALHTGEVHLATADGGPNSVYLATTGFLMGGALLFGVVQRRRGAHVAPPSGR